MSRKARKALAREQAASTAIEAERAREQAIRDMREEIRAEEYEEKRRVSLERREVAMRQSQLKETLSIVRGREAALAKEARLAEEKENWVRYMTCDGLPNPGIPSDMNTFMYLWTTEGEEASMQNVAQKCNVVTRLLTKLREIVRSSGKTSKEYAIECETIAREFRDQLQRWIDLACYGLLRRIETDMKREDTKTAKYVHVSSDMVCCLWAPIALPVGTKRHTDKERKSVELHFEEIGLAVKMPIDVDCYRSAIRGLWLAHDRYSFEASSRAIPRLPEKFTAWDSQDLLEFSQRENAEKHRIREEQYEERRARFEKRRALLERMENEPVAGPTATATTTTTVTTTTTATTATTEKRGKRPKKHRAPRSAVGGQSSEGEATSRVETFATIESVESAETDRLPYLPTPDEIIRRSEEENRKETRRQLFARCGKTEVNLRKYRILGGVFRVDLIQQPPQPKETGKETFLTTLELPKETRFVPFSRHYEPPPSAPDSERTPEVIEAEMKALETAMEALVLVTLKLPGSVLWSEPPLVAHWVQEKKKWSTRDVHDLKYNEENQTIAFRTGRLGIHGLAAYRYVNLPFQSWELKPESGRNARGGVVLSVTAAIVQAEFVAREDKVCLNSLAGGTSTVLKGILGEYTKLNLLVQRMREAGCDLFPERDAPSYLKGLATKHPVAERHLRECMALLCTAYNFAWSRWNATRGYREIALQFKELHGCVAKERTNTTLLVTPCRAVPLRCTEVSQEFSDTPLEGEENEFYADLYHLALRRAGIKSRLTMSRLSHGLASTVVRLLELTNVIGMSS